MILEIKLSIGQPVFINPERVSIMRTVFNGPTCHIAELRNTFEVELWTDGPNRIKLLQINSPGGYEVGNQLLRALQELFNLTKEKHGDIENWTYEITKDGKLKMDNYRY